MSRHLVWRTLAVLAVVGVAVYPVSTRPIRLGLDLEDGTQIVLQAQDTESQRIDDDTLTRTLEVMRRRVDELGVAEPSLQRSGGDRIIIELPGVTDPQEALEVIGRTAQHEEEVEVSRQELKQDDWTIEVPISFEQRLRALGVPAPPE